ncbi:MAG TPA: ATP-binding protein [Polyangiaceae bacterium]|nr:ATP-binding protein [Polyangiaceae bacterium]
MASRGAETEWSAEGTPVRPAAVVALPDVESVASFPFLDALLGALGVPAASVVSPVPRPGAEAWSTFHTFHVKELAGGPLEPGKGFVHGFEIACAFGFGGFMPSGHLFSLIIFSNVELDATAARFLSILQAYAKLALADSVEARAVAGDASAAEREALLFALLRAVEAEAGATETSLASAVGVASAVAEQAARRRQQDLEEQNVKLTRTQRAMLNVIEDLRDARASLERRVVLRTEELAAVNRSLATRNQELEDFVYIASHDLQEPLRTVSGYLQIIDRRYRGQLGTDADEFITFAIDGAQRMQALIESLLMYSRVSTRTHELEPLMLDEALDAALDNLAFSIDDTKAVIRRAPLPRVPADRIQMVQLFQNLLSNAIKFRGDGPPKIFVDAEKQGNEWAIRVRDQGMGFNPKFTDRIFKMFRRLQRSHPGTGVGLAICKKIVDRHGGRITADAVIGGGATFVFTLPEA